MQTFLPYASFEKTFKCLDWRRLNKQRLEAKQIFNVITGRTDKKGWIHHPAVVMWRQHPHFLALYHNECIFEWKKRGYNNNMPLIQQMPDMVEEPRWWGDERFHSSHRQTLLSKNYEWYNQFGWSEYPKYEYFWPSKCEDYIEIVKKG